MGASSEQKVWRHETQALHPDNLIAAGVRDLLQWLWQGWKAQLLLLPIGAPGFQDTGRAEVM